ncbi:hypothetical protein K438DRAFT_1230826 [Mycena galopus ATCC 62051]|nr:hypothetical protein K438DRAFT_1230826 [Mycena galopus ATCC 62051]
MLPNLGLRGGLRAERGMTVPRKRIFPPWTLNLSLTFVRRASASPTPAHFLPLGPRRVRKPHIPMLVTPTPHGTLHPNRLGQVIQESSRHTPSLPSVTILSTPPLIPQRVNSLWPCVEWPLRTTRTSFTLVSRRRLPCLFLRKFPTLKSAAPRRCPSNGTYTTRIPRRNMVSTRPWDATRSPSTHTSGPMVVQTLLYTGPVVFLCLPFFTLVYPRTFIPIP